MSEKRRIEGEAGERDCMLMLPIQEILTKEKGCYSELSDVYSFGVIMWELMSRKTPFESLPPGTIATRVVQGIYTKIQQKEEKMMLKF